MSNAFMQGMRSAALNGNNVRTPVQRSADQNGTVSGNPRTIFNMPVRPMPPQAGVVAPGVQMQQQGQAIPMPKQYIPPMMQTQQPMQQQQGMAPMGANPLQRFYNRPMMR